MNDQHTALYTERTNIYPVSEGHAVALQCYLLKNKARLAAVEPLRTADYYQLTAVSQRIRTAVIEQQDKRGLFLVVTLKESEQVIGCIHFSQWVLGVFQACYLGFSIDEDFEGQGIMAEALDVALIHLKQQYRLHRVMANHLVDNVRSQRLLQRLGFEQEGYAKSYLKINGIWQDHVLNALVFAENE